MQKLFYGISKEDKAILTDHLLDKKFSGNIDDWLFGLLKNQVLNIKRSILNGQFNLAPGMSVPLSKESLDKIIIDFDKKYAYTGEKGVLVCGDKLYEGLVEWFKVEKLVNAGIGVPTKAKSFEDFMQDNILARINEIKVENWSKELDAEKPQKVEVELAPQK